MAYVLIVIFWAGYGPRSMLEMQDFSSEATCRAAALHIIKEWGADRIKVECVRH